MKRFAGRTLLPLSLALMLSPFALSSDVNTPGEDPRAAEQLAKDKASAARARDVHLREEKEFQEFRRRVLERRRADKRRRAAVVDPDMDSFWRKEQTARLGRQLILTVPLGRRVVLYRHRNPLQFHGRRGHVHKRKPRVYSGKAAPRDKSDLTAALTRKKGYYIPLSVPDAPGPVKLKGDVELLSTVINGETYDLVNIYSDGVDIILVEMELRGRAGMAGEYFQWSVDKIYLEHK